MMFSLIFRVSRWYLRRPVVFNAGAVRQWLEAHPAITVISSHSSLEMVKVEFPLIFSSNSVQIIQNPPIEVQDLEAFVPQIQHDWVVGIGAGRIMDAAKFLASRAKKKLCLIPTALSTTSWLNMAIALRKERHLHFPGARHADIAIVDPDLIIKVPPALSLGGFADILCAATAITDWRLGHEQTGEKFSTKAYSAYLTWIQRAIARPEVLKPFTTGSIQFLYSQFLESLSLCGASMSGRPLEGGEHFLYYALDELSPKSLVHGGTIALAILIGLRLQGDQIPVPLENIKKFFDASGIPYRLKDIGITPALLGQALQSMSSFTKAQNLPFSVWNMPEIMSGANSVENILRWVQEW